MTNSLVRSTLVRLVLLGQIVATIFFATVCSGAAAYGQAAIAGTQVQIGSDFNCAVGAVSDTSGNIYIIDEGGNCTGGPNEINTLFKETLQPNGTYVESIIPTSVKPYTFGFYSIAIDSKGNIFIADQTNDRVIEESPNGTGYTETTILPPTTSTPQGIIEPAGVAVDLHDNVYISDYNNWQILKETVNGAGYTQSIIIPAGYGNPNGISFPTCMAFDSSGNLYLCDNRFSISEWLYSGGTNGTYTKSTTFPNYSGEGAPPSGLAVDTAGNYYTTTSKFTLKSDGTFLQSPVGDAAGGYSVFVDGTGTIYVAGGLAPGSIAKIQTPINSAGAANLGSVGTVTVPFYFSQAGSTGVGVVVRTEGSTAQDFTDAGTGTCDTNGTTHSYAKNESCTVVLSFTPQATGLRTGVVQLINTIGYANGVVFANSNVSGTGTGPLVGFGFAAPATVATGVTAAAGLATDAAGDVFIATSPTSTTGAVLEEKPSGSTYAGSTALTTAYGVNFSGPTGLSLDNQGDFFVADTANNRIVQGYLNLGSYIPYNNVTGIGTGLNKPKGVAVDALGVNIFIADTGNNRIVQDKLVVYNSSSPAYAQYVLPMTGLSSPSGIAMDAAGNLYIADTGNNRILKETLQPYVPVTNIGAPSNPPVGTTYVQTVIGTGFNAPQGVFVDAQGNIFVADTGNNRIVEESLVSGAYVQSVIPTVGTTLAGPTAVTVDGSHTIYISDTGNNRVIKIGITTAAPTVSFASTAVGSTSNDSPQTLVVTNIGSTPLTISIPASGTNPSLSSTTNFSLNTTGSTACPSLTNSSSSAATIAPNATCTLSLTFAPTQPGTDTATLTFTDNSGNATAATQVINLTGNGTSASAPAVTLTSSAAFGAQPEGVKSALKPLTLTNSGTATLNITSITLAGTNPADFAIDPTTTCGTSLAQGSSCTIYVSFTPAGVAGYSATVSVVDNATGSPHTASLTGNGTYVAPTVTLLPSPIAFGNIVQGNKSSAQTVTLTNTGTSMYYLTSTSVSDATDYTYTTTCGSTLAPTNTCTFSVTFQPQSINTLNATLNVNDTTDSVNASASLTGVGTAAAAPIASITTPINFGSQTINTGTVQTLTLSNTGTATLNITGVTLGGANPTYFTKTGGTCSTTLAAGNTCTVIITFTPTAATSYSATVSVADNAAGSPQVATLSGTGVVQTDFGVTATTPSVSVVNGSIAQFTINVAALSGSYNRPVVMSVTGLPTGATATFTPASVTPGSIGVTTILAIQTPSLLANNRDNRNGVWFGLLLLPFFTRRARKALQHLPKTLRALLLCVVGLGALLPLIGCDGGFFGPTAHTSTLTVTGTSGATQHSTTITLTVQ